MINFKAITRIIGILLLLETGFLLVCTGVSLYYRDEGLVAFCSSACITAGVGLMLLLAGRGSSLQLTRRDGYVLVTFAWVAFSIFGVLPFYLSGCIPSFTNAYFETMSGFSTTGASILDDVESLPHSMLFWRNMTQWIGGLGIIMFTIAVLPIFGVSGLQVFAAETSGPTHSKAHPRIGVTAKWIWSIYVGITSMLVVLLMLGGMNGFDSICHAFSTVGTGGFSTRQSNIAFYHSPYIEYVITFFMFVCGINFTLLLFIFTGRFNKFFRDTELKCYFGMVVIFTVIITCILYFSSSCTGEEAFRHALFQVVTLQTSTGFNTMDYMTWPAVAWGMLIVLMVVGACAGSTSGGLKCIRVVVLAEVLRNEFKHILHPNAVLPVRINRQVISPSVVSTVLAFSFFYMIITGVSVLLMLAMGVGFDESIGCVIASLGNMGLSLGELGPAHSWNALPDLAKWLSSFLMLLGRLELFTVLLLFTPDFWRKS